MAVTTDVVASWVAGDRRETIVDVTLDSSYATGGEAVTPEELGFIARVDHVEVGVDGGYVVVYDHANAKFQAFVGDNDGTSDGPLAEAASTTDLDQVTVRVRCVGV